MKIVLTKEPSRGWTVERGSNLHQSPIAGTTMFNSSTTDHESLQGSQTSSIGHPSEDAFGSSRSYSKSSLGSIRTGNPNVISVKEAKKFSFVLSVYHVNILHVSGAIMKDLKYELNMLYGQCLLNYLYPRDRLTFSNNLTQAIQSRFQASSDTKGEKFTFYVRLRKYIGLFDKGYNIAEQKPDYKPYKLSCTIEDVQVNGKDGANIMCRDTGSDQLVHKGVNLLGLTDSEPSYQEGHNIICFLVDAIPVDCVYQLQRETPAMTPFVTRHTAACNFSHIDCSAIPYLGYLPQDLIGNQVYSFYHPDDYKQIRTAYEMLTQDIGKPYRSKPYRFKVFNGDYVMLETEWSCFIHPWTKRIEFVIGQHRVLHGPENINLFNEENTKPERSTDLKEARVQEEQNYIVSLLREPVKKVKSISNVQKKHKLAKYITRIAGCEEVIPDSVFASEGSDADSVGVGVFRQFTKSSTHGRAYYHELRLLDNIERFFKSNPATQCKEELDSPPGKSSGEGESTESIEGTSNCVKQTHFKDQTSSPPEQINKEESKSTDSSGDSGLDTIKTGENQCEIAPTEGVSTDEVQHKAQSTSLVLTEKALKQHNKMTMKDFLKKSQAFNQYVLGTDPLMNVKRPLTSDIQVSNLKKHQKLTDVKQTFTKEPKECNGAVEMVKSKRDKSSRHSSHSIEKTIPEEALKTGNADGPATSNDMKNKANDNLDNSDSGQQLTSDEDQDVVLRGVNQESDSSKTSNEKMNITSKSSSDADMSILTSTSKSITDEGLSDEVTGSRGFLKLASENSMTDEVLMRYRIPTSNARYLLEKYLAELEALEQPRLVIKQYFQLQTEMKMEKLYSTVERARTEEKTHQSNSSTTESATR